MGSLSLLELVVGPLHEPPVHEHAEQLIPQVGVVGIGLQDGLDQGKAAAIGRIDLVGRLVSQEATQSGEIPSQVLR